MYFKWKKQKQSKISSTDKKEKKTSRTMFCLRIKAIELCPFAPLNRLANSTNNHFQFDNKQQSINQ